MKHKPVERPLEKLLARTLDDWPENVNSPLQLPGPTGSSRNNDSGNLGNPEIVLCISNYSTWHKSIIDAAPGREEAAAFGRGHGGA
jgi:capsid portal protein